MWFAFKNCFELNIRSDSLGSREGCLDAPTDYIEASARAGDLSEVKVRCCVGGGGLQEEAALQVSEPGA